MPASRIVCARRSSLHRLAVLRRQRQAINGGCAAEVKKLERQRLEEALQRKNWLLLKSPDQFAEDPVPKLAELVETQGRPG